jgi:type I protein arginine methyltransferase
MNDSLKPSADVFQRAFQKWNTQLVRRPNLGEFPIYDDQLYQWLLDDGPRVNAYAKAIARVAANRVALDLGTGSEAPLAIMGARAGAKKVYALERLPASAAAARERIKSVGLSHIIEVYEGNSTETALAEGVDLCVSEVIGNIGGLEGAAAILHDARRFLKPDGIMIPGRCITLAAPAVHSEAYYSDEDVERVNQFYVNAIYKAVGHRFPITRFATFNLPRSNLLAAPDVFEDLDFTNGTLPPSSRTIAFRLERDAVCAGFVLWVRLHVDEHNIVDTWSGTSWAPVFLDAAPFAVRCDDELLVECRIELSANGVNPNYELACALQRDQKQIRQFTISSPYIGAPVSQDIGVE